jgi:hypothetical protein
MIKDNPSFSATAVFTEKMETDLALYGREYDVIFGDPSYVCVYMYTN